MHFRGRVEILFSFLNRIIKTKKLVYKINSEIFAAFIKQTAIAIFLCSCGEDFPLSSKFGVCSCGRDLQVLVMVVV